MDSLRLRLLDSPSTPLHFNKHVFFFSPTRISLPFHHPHSHSHLLTIVCRVSSTKTRQEEKKKNMRGASLGGRVRLSVRLDLQVEFGEHVAVLGSTKELGSWKKEVGLAWSESGWVCELDLKGGGVVEFKFVILGKDKSVLWEDGDNRVLELPKGGSFGVVCHWNVTGEALDLLPLMTTREGEDVEDVAEDDASVAALEVEASPFVGQWQGKAISFMRSNENGSREMQRKWDTSGLQGLPLKLVEGDRDARNWWRKLIFYIIIYLCQLSSLICLAVFLSLKADIEWVRVLLKPSTC